jgi:hypothetical protein
MKAQQNLDTAAELVGGDRAKQHGDARRLHEQVARLWREYLDDGGPVRVDIDAADVLAMLALLKLARTQHGEFNRDDWVDALGYVALAGQVAEEDHEQEALERRAAEAPVYR